ncbi:MAG: LLM class flavin-dependent oxidoreductase [Acidimicrobiales bacterium]
MTAPLDPLTSLGSHPVPAFGLFLPQMRMPYDVFERRVRAAERAGFASVWLMDHLAPPGAQDQPMFEAWTLASFIAARTETIRIGHLVLCGSFRHPAVLARMAASLDVLSGGRLELGMGWGSSDDELRQHGMYAPPRVRAARLKETLDILRLLFTGERVSYAGEHYQLDGAISLPTPAQARIPVHIGGRGEKLTMPLVREYADWWNCPIYAMAEIDQLRPLAGPARVSVQHVVALVLDESTRDQTLQLASRRYGSWGSVLGGSAQELAARFAEDAARGAELIICQFSDFGTEETIERFGAEVVPAVAAHLGS